MKDLGFFLSSRRVLTTLVGSLSGQGKTRQGKSRVRVGLGLGLRLGLVRVELG